MILRRGETRSAQGDLAEHADDTVASGRECLPSVPDFLEHQVRVAVVVRREDPPASHFSVDGTAHVHLEIMERTASEAWQCQQHDALVPILDRGPKELEPQLAQLRLGVAEEADVRGEGDDGVIDPEHARLHQSSEMPARYARATACSRERASSFSISRCTWLRTVV